MTRRLLPRIALTLGVLLAVSNVVPASAEPRPTLDQVKAQVTALHERAEAASEEYNAGRIELAAANSRLAAQQRAVKDARKKVDAQRVVVGQFAADAYRNGGLGGQDALTVLLTSDDPTSTLQKLATAEVLERRNSSVLREIESARQQLRQAERVAEQEADRARTISAGLEERKSEVEGLLGDATRLLDKLTAEEKARLAAERAAEERRQAAEAAAERARIEAAERAERAERQRAAARAAAQPERSAPSGGSGSSGSGRSGGAGSGSGGGGNDAPPQSAEGGTKATRAVKAALSKLGKPYVWGAAGPNSFDCSGLVQWAYKQVGVYVPHYTGSIWTSFPRVSRSELKPGDVILYYPDVHHTGIYIGGGKMVHAPSTGDVVKISDAFAGRQYTGAVRIVG